MKKTSNVLARCFSPTMVKAALAIGFLLPSAAQANLFLGSFFSVGAVNIKTGSIAFQGPFTVLVGSGGFSALTGTTGFTKPITNPPYVTPGVTVFETPNFMTFNAAPNISFTLEVLGAGVNGAAGCAATPAAAGQSCTPPNSPFNLQNLTSSSSTATFSVRGFEVDAATSTTAPFTGLFSSTFPNDSFQSLLTKINSGQTINTTFAASFTVTPEPSIFLPLGAGMLALFGARAFRKRVSNNV